MRDAFLVVYALALLPAASYGEPPRQSSRGAAESAGCVVSITDGDTLTELALLILSSSGLARLPNPTRTPDGFRNIGGKE